MKITEEDFWDWRTNIFTEIFEVSVCAILFFILPFAGPVCMFFVWDECQGWKRWLAPLALLFGIGINILVWLGIVFLINYYRN